MLQKDCWKDIKILQYIMIDLNCSNILCYTLIDDKIVLRGKRFFSMQNGVMVPESGTEQYVRKTNYPNNSWPTVSFICLSSLCRFCCQFSSLLFLLQLRAFATPIVLYLVIASCFSAFCRIVVAVWFGTLIIVYWF